MKLRISKKLAGIGAVVVSLGIITAGFLGFYTLIVPQLVTLSALSLSAVVGFSVLAGILSFFAPCSLAIFPSYMGYYLSKTEDSNRASALRSGVIASLGMVLFYGILGITVSYIGGLASVQSILRIGIPAMAVVLGAVGVYFLAGNTTSGRLSANLGSRFIQVDNATDRNLFLFGFGYSMSSIACIFPVFLLLIAYPLITGNVALGVTAFLAFAAGKSALMVVATILASESRMHILTKRSKQFTYVKRGSGFLLVLVAAYLTYYTFALYGVINPML